MPYRGKLGLKTIYTASGWTGRIRTCECWDQNPVPYRLATVQSPVILAQEDKTVEQRKATPERAAIFYDGLQSNSIRIVGATNKISPSDQIR